MAGIVDDEEIKRIIAERVIGQVNQTIVSKLYWRATVLFLIKKPKVTVHRDSA
jgi:hypothetical protein